LLKWFAGYKETDPVLKTFMATWTANKNFLVFDSEGRITYLWRTHFQSTPNLHTTCRNCCRGE